MERQEDLLLLLEQAGNNISELARQLGEPRETVRDHIRKLRDQKAMELAQENTEDGFVPAPGPQCVDLFISDLQLPFQHPDAFDFLREIKRKFQPDRVFNVGDLIDQYGFTFFDKDPSMPSVVDEMDQVRQAVNELSEIFPKQKICLGNHDMRIFRQAEKAGIPRQYVKDLNHIIGAPVGWEWRDKWVIEFPNKECAVMVHNCGNRDATKGVHRYGYSVIQGHYDTVSEVKYISNLDKLMFGMTVGSLINKRAKAFAYNKLHIQRPILSAGVVLNGKPMIIPMTLNKKGRWVGSL